MGSHICKEALVHGIPVISLSRWIRVMKFYLIMQKMAEAKNSQAICSYSSFFNLLFRFVVKIWTTEPV